MHSMLELALQGGLLVMALGVMLTVVRRVRQAKAVQDRLVEVASRSGVDSWVRIYVSRPGFFARPLKLVGFEARGVLTISKGAVRILAEWPSGERLDRSIGRSDLALSWLGNARMASANLHWIAVGQGQTRLMLSADTGFNAVQSREATADICRRIDPDFSLPAMARRDFALEKNPASLAVVAAFFALLAFALIDGAFTNQHELLETGAWLPWGVLLLAACAFPVYGGLTRSGVPSRESVSLSMLIAVALSLAYVPAVKRIDQLLADGGSRPYPYRLADNAVLQPMVDGPPVIDYRRQKRYWAQFEPGSIQQLDLVHGPLGLWQLDRRRLERRMRAFYDRHPDRAD